MLVSHALPRARPPGSMRPFAAPLAQEWRMTLKGVALAEATARPVNSPIWLGVEGEMQMSLSANLDLPLYAAIVRVGAGPGHAEERTTPEAAISAALAGYRSRSLVSLNNGPRSRDADAADIALVTVIDNRPDGPG